jgi:hypothetical protein
MTDTEVILKERLEKFYVEEKRLQDEIKEMMSDLVFLQNRIEMLEAMIKFKQYEKGVEL